MRGRQAAECLAREVALQEQAETSGGEYLWVWEVEELAVVMGRSADCASEVRQEACRREDVPVLRRESGGRTVLLGKGCLNYTLVLDLDMGGVQESYRIILKAILEAAGVRGAGCEFTDLTVGNRKFGGCAQRRRRSTLLHHGTILYDFDVAAMGRYLRSPGREPTYRDGRSHEDFLTNVELHPDFGGRLAEQFPGVEVVE